jgi:MFS family permease
LTIKEGAAPPTRRAPRFFYGWVIVAVAGLLQFAGGTETFPVLGLFLKPMTSEFGWSKSLFTLPMTIGTILGGFSAVLVGPAMDRWGGRWIMGISALALGAAFVLLGFTQNVWQYFVLQIIARGFTTGAFFMVAGIVIPKWFVAKRGRASAFSGLGGRAGHIVLPLMTFSVLSAWDWRAAWIALGIMIWALTLLPVMLFLRRTPEDMGLLPDGVTSGEVAKTATGSGRQSKAAARVRQEVSMKPREVLRHPAFYFILIAQCLMSFTISGTHFHWFSYMTGKGIDDGVVVSTVAFSNIVSIPMSLVSGFLAERFHVRHILAVTHAGFALTFVLMALANDSLGAYAFAAALGLASGVSFTVGAIVFADYYGRQSLGAIRGMTAPVTLMTNAMGPLLASVAFDILDSYAFIVWLFVGLSSLAAVMWAIALPPKHAPVEAPEKVPA